MWPTDAARRKDAEFFCGQKLKDLEFEEQAYVRELIRMSYLRLSDGLIAPGPKMDKNN